jgi:hypothetical protein
VELPFEAKEWWAQLIPGFLGAIDLFLLHDVSILAYAHFQSEPAAKTILDSVATSSAEVRTAVAVLSILASIILGAWLAGFAYRRNEKALLSEAGPQFKAQGERFRPCAIEAFGQRWNRWVQLSATDPIWLSMADILEFLAYYKGSEQAVRSIDKSYTAWRFTNAIFYPLVLALVLFPAMAFYRGFYLLGLMLALLILLLVRELKWGSNALSKRWAQAYWRKLFLWYILVGANDEVPPKEPWAD